MVDGTYQRAGVGELMSCIGIFFPLSLEAIQFVEEIIVVNVKFVGTNANYGT